MRKIKVMHVVASWTIGGTEKMLMYSIPQYSTERFEMKIVSLVDATHLTEEWEKTGIIVSHLGAARQKFSLSALLRLRQAILDWKPDIVFTYGQRSGFVAKLVKLMTFQRYKLVFGQRNAGTFRNRIETWMEWCLQGLTDLYVSNSTAGALYLKNHAHISEKRITTIGNGVDFPISVDVHKKAKAVKATHAIPDSAFVIGAVGRILPVKGHEFLVRAMPEIVRNIPHALLVIVGEDRSDGVLQALAGDIGMSDRIRFIGLSHDIAAWHAVMDVFVLPSLSEGMSVATIEAMFSSLPVIATHVGGTPEVVVDKQTGVLVPPQDSASLAIAVVELYRKPELRRQLGTAGRERAESCFTLVRMIKEYESVFEDLVQ